MSQQMREHKVMCVCLCVCVCVCVHDLIISTFLLIQRISVQQLITVQSVLYLTLWKVCRHASVEKYITFPKVHKHSTHCVGLWQFAPVLWVHFKAALINVQTLTREKKKTVCERMSEEGLPVSLQLSFLLPFHHKTLLYWFIQGGKQAQINPSHVAC